MIQLVQLATGSQWRPETIRLIMPRSRVVKQCPLLTKSRIIFSQPISAIAIRASLLQLPVHIDIPASVKITNNKQADFYNNFDDAIRQIINTYSLTKNISIEDISRATDISVRSLQRRLKDEGLKFNDLLNQAKFFHAKNELRDPQMTIKEISESLGYTDPANFTRAFRRWSGLSPSGFRKLKNRKINLE
jgi:AraC-like DNA-binding protein